MTADAMVGTRERCLKAGMDEYISKPINTDELRHIISRWVTLPDEDKKAAPAPSGKEEAASVDLSNLRQFSETESDLREFISLFLSESAEGMNILRQNRVDGESKPWSGAAHKLKGGAANVGAEKLRALCARAQEMTSAGADARKVLFAEIEAEYARVRDYLKKYAG